MTFSEDACERADRARGDRKDEQVQRGNRGTRAAADAHLLDLALRRHALLRWLEEATRSFEDTDEEQDAYREALDQVEAELGDACASHPRLSGIRAEMLNSVSLK